MTERAAMRHEWLVLEATEAQLSRLAERLALKLAPGDTIALEGELGSGKTTFARALIRALLGDEAAEVPSPTFSLLQSYETPRLPVAHMDLYRIGGEDEAAELGAEEMRSRGALIVEWAERAPRLFGADRLEIRLSDGQRTDTRRVAMTGHGAWAARLKRVGEVSEFLSNSPAWAQARVRHLQGDASARSYARLGDGGRTAVLMDAPRQADGPPIRGGLPYSRIAHLAEDVRPFVAVQAALRAVGLSVPEIYAAELERGLLLLEDLGDRVFGREISAGTNQAELWTAATDALALLAGCPVPESLALPDGSVYRLPPQDSGVLGIEAELLLDWYWPLIKGAPAPAEVREEFLGLWGRVFEPLAQLPRGWVLRDYHSPNLMWLPDREGVGRTGILDFQDALLGPSVYDLVSLLQDARVDVPAELEAQLFERYTSAVSREGRGLDRDATGFAYSALGAQRNTKILGIFARLARRDGKTAYLCHVPRLWGYLVRDLAHAALAPLRAWYDRHFPAHVRTRRPKP